MRFEVPQFIDVEDKIFGELSLKQFIYVAGGLGAAATLFFSPLPFIVFLILAPLIVGLAFGLAFVPVNKRPLSILLEAAVQYLTRSRLYLWRKIERAPTPTPDTNTHKKAYTPPETQNTIASLSRDLELKALNENTQTPAPQHNNKKNNT